MTTSDSTASLSVQGFRHGRVPREVRAAQLLDIAEELFILKGYEGFSIEDLRRLAGVSRPVVYEHFGTKDAIYVACIRRFHDAYDPAISEAANHSSTPRDLIEAGASAFFAALEANPRAWTLVYSAPGIVGPVADEVERIRSSSVERIEFLARLLLPGGVADERVTAAARFISGAGEELGRWWMKNTHIALQGIVTYHCDFIESILDGELRRTTRPAPGSPT
ncbi:TetR/AcrR family transcriptional regulator [Rhodococcoides yunnanense]|uniref:TetR/AcrR family transcriptional regulator n=1 Tax=Rhodococcoides yunnanense TaxID=278209 RepID=A0ABU4BCL1_9NOCA|nr:TetR/AcrR family transcriptional regulator [Rhodococcus yunnanensis]MDV6261915.1 TetR/AcrR family transcriptional regulator [Rhodococcus yunnanensis]